MVDKKGDRFSAEEAICQQVTEYLAFQGEIGVEYESNRLNLIALSLRRIGIFFASPASNFSKVAFPAAELREHYG
jgi:hypothetical protein